MFNHDIRAEYLIRNISDVSKKMFDERWLITKRGYSEIFIPLEGYKSYSEFFTSSLDFEDNSLNLSTYLQIKKILNDNHIEINIEDVEYNLDDIVTQLNLLNY